jgi:hypothetical protein
MNLKQCGLERSLSSLRICPGIYLEDLRKITKTLNKSIRCTNRGLNLEPPEYGARVLITWSRYLQSFSLSFSLRSVRLYFRSPILTHFVYIVLSRSYYVLFASNCTTFLKFLMCSSILWEFNAETICTRQKIKRR